MIDTALLAQEARKLGLNLTEEQLNDFDRFAELLDYWNKQINLTAIKDPTEMVYKHFADSLTALAAAPMPPGASFVDVGTGGGFPGLPLLIARRDLHGVLLDSTQKKLLFVDRVLTGLNLTQQGRTLHMRAEEAGRTLNLRNRFDFSVSRAVANLRELSEYCLPLTKVGGTFVALKGSKAKEELREAQQAIRLLGGEVADVQRYFLGEMGERHVIVIRKTSPTPPKFPRASAKIAKEPLTTAE